MCAETRQIPFGRGHIGWVPPTDMRVTWVDKPTPPPLPEAPTAIRAALDDPLGTEPLEQLARGATRITIVVTDATRPCPDHLLVSAIVERLTRAGVPDSAITILVAIGMHRPSTREEKVEKLGLDLVQRFPVIDSAATDPDLQVDLGLSPDGVPIRIDRRAAEADLLLATGIVEPHQYAGFSGGWKTVAIGTAGAATITALHGMRYLEDPGVRLAVTDGNPFLDTARWVGERAGLRFVVNVALDSGGQIIAVRAGHPEAVHQDLAGWVRERSIVKISAPSPIVIGAAGHPKDANIYQATRIPTYLCFGRRPVVERGGVILVPAPCPEGAGHGPGEQLFLEMLSRGLSPAGVVEDARKNGYPAGGQRAVMVAWALQQCRIAFVGTEDGALVRRCGLDWFATLEEAVSWARAETGSDQILVVPRALTTLPETE